MAFQSHLSDKRTTPHFLFVLIRHSGVGGTSLSEMKKKSKLDELLDIIRPVIAKGVKCQSNKGEVEVNKAGSISEISHEPSNLDESYADKWTKVTCVGSEFELKRHIPAIDDVPEYDCIQTVNIEFSVFIENNTIELIEPIIIR